MAIGDAFKNVYGPYETRIVMAQGKTDINGPHQGGWVDTPYGESWFCIFRIKELMAVCCI